MDNVNLQPHQAESASATAAPSMAVPFSCNVCKKNYTRIDHLARHFRSHSRERPYECKTCQKTFARVDLLKRHENNHEVNGPKTCDRKHKRRKTVVNPGQPRAIQACTACAASKVKCGGTQPCERCLDRQTTCKFSEPRSDSADPKGLYNTETLQLSEGTISSAALHWNPLSTPMDEITPIHLRTDLPSAANNDLQKPLEPLYSEDVRNELQMIKNLDVLGSAAVGGQEFSFSDLENILDDSSLPKDVLDFGVELTFDTPSIFDMDYIVPSQQVIAQQSHDLQDDALLNWSGRSTPGLGDKINIVASIKAFKESLWLWTPQADDHSGLEQQNLFLSSQGGLSSDKLGHSLPLLREEANNTTRGKILAEVLKSCEPSIHCHVISNFPDTKLLTNLVHKFLEHHLEQDFTWIHCASIEINKECPLFLISIIASGAAASPSPKIRKLGFALQEALRESHPREFERDNRRTRDLRSLQSFALSLDIGLWSGDRRKMEISESFAMPLLTMIRRAGHYHLRAATELPPLATDEGSDLESKWRSWIRQESFTRLALYLFYRDIRSSLSLLTQPLVSYAEVATALPCHSSLWLAKTAIEWKTAYLARCCHGTMQFLSIRSCIDEGSSLFEHRDTIDMTSSLLMVNAAVWPLVWQFREMKSAARFRRAPDLKQCVTTMESRLQEVTQLLSHIRVSASEEVGDLEPNARLLHEQCYMHLYVSLEDVQALAGREGEEGAQRIFPALVAWVESADARRALFHAAQIVRVARMYPKGTFRDAIAVAVYHASLVFWAYSILYRKQSMEISSHTSIQTLQPGLQKLVRLDGEDSPELQRFLTFGKGTPCIGRHLETTEIDTSKDVLLKDTSGVMVVFAKLLESPLEGGEETCPPLLKNLSTLVGALGNAARKAKQAPT